MKCGRKTRAVEPEVPTIQLADHLAQEDVDVLNQLSARELKMLRNVNQTSWADYELHPTAESRPVDQLSITGMSLVCNPGAFWLRRAIWLAIIICLLVWLCFQLKLCIERLSAGGTVRTWSRQNVPAIPLPAITVCHGNVFKKSVVLRHQLNGSDWQAWRQSGYATLDWSSFSDLTRFYEDATYAWGDMVLFCLVDGRPCERLGKFRTARTLLHGLCTTFVTNSTVGKRLVTGQVTLVLRERERLDEFEHAGWKVFLHPQDVRYNDFVFFTGQVTQLKVYSNRLHQMKVFRKITETLPSGSGRGCVASPDAGAAYLGCLGRCLMAGLTAGGGAAAAAAGRLCAVPWISAKVYPAGVGPCRSLAELERSSAGSHEGVSEGDFIAWTSECPCSPSCQMDQYQVDQHEKWHIEETSIYLQYPSARSLTVGVVELWLSDVVENIVEREAYSFDTFIAEVGGNLGLMLGGSLLTFVEIFDCVLASCISRRQKRASQRG